MINLINTVREHGCDVVNDNGTLRVRGATGSLPADVLDTVRASKPELLTWLVPASTRWPYTVKAPLPEVCADCDAEIGLISIRLGGGEVLCRACAVGVAPGLTQKRVNCLWCGLAVVRSTGKFIKDGKRWYCTEGCYKEEAACKRKNRIRAIGTGKRGKKSQTLSEPPSTQTPLPQSPIRSSPSPTPSNAAKFDRYRADMALQTVGLELAGQPTDHAQGWRVSVRARVSRVPLGHRLISPAYTVLPGAYRNGAWHTDADAPIAPAANDQFDPLGGNSWERK